MKLQIEKAIYGGAGLAREEGKAVFVPFTLPGETVEAHLVQDKGSFASAELDAVLTPSPSRIAPSCPYFGSCGGCSYQHATYPEQLAMKASILRESLGRARLENVPEIVTHASEPYGYRNRIRLHIDRASSRLGYRQRGSHRELAVEICPIAAPVLQKALQALTAACVAQQAGAYFQEAELFTNHDGSQLLLSLWLRSGATDPRNMKSIAALEVRLATLCAAVQQKVPVLSGAGALTSPEPAFSQQNRQQGRRQPKRPAAKMNDAIGVADEADPGTVLASWGKPSLTYLAAGHAHEVSLGAFFQVNRFLVDELVTLAVADQKGQLAWDLYAGVGLFASVLAERFAEVIAVEAAPVSSRDLRGNLARAIAPGLQTSAPRAATTSTVEFLRRQANAPRSAANAGVERNGPLGSLPATNPARPDFILVDPPRAGLGPEVTGLLGRIRAPHITYVSCDPATLSRDLAALVESGYQIKQLHLVDLFPQTFHLETVAMLTLG